ncbi:MAG: phosphonate ABC transporter ATP-binding protein [Desulfobulbaceae bacterium]|nr:phosphonate ABC transporter ATP-binding protein [Desulfobulbaceae bacterium]
MIELNNVSLGYNKKPVLNNLDLHISKGEFVGIIGLSGAGKSTLLMSLIGNIQILSGRYNVIGYQLGTISKKHLKELRTRIGFIFQGYNLVDRLNVLHNIMSGMLGQMSLSRALIKWYGRQELAKGYKYMQTVDISECARQRCDELSGGQRQRVAIARALAQEPDILLADEPVAALDPKSAAQVMDILQTINRQYGVTIIANLHHLDFARKYCSRILGIADGDIIFDGLPEELAQRDLDRIYKIKNTETCDEDMEEIDISHLMDAARIRPKRLKKVLKHEQESVKV